MANRELNSTGIDWVWVNGKKINEKWVRIRTHNCKDVKGGNNYWDFSIVSICAIFSSNSTKEYKTRYTWTAPTLLNIGPELVAKEVMLCSHNKFGQEAPLLALVGSSTIYTRLISCSRSVSLVCVSTCTKGYNLLCFFPLNFKGNNPNPIILYPLLVLYYSKSTYL